MTTDEERTCENCGQGLTVADNGFAGLCEECWIKEQEEQA